jgi:photosystem II stability/assembly factor-like uncharacterized protein
MFFVVLFLCAALLLPGAKRSKAVKSTGGFDYGEAFKLYEPRNIGPANMGGRTVDFAVVESNTSIIYAAVGPSGLWKSADNGIHWSPSFVNEATVAAGCVAVSASHPDIVWVGAGEATSRNSVGIGDGVYKSGDAGKTWKHMGLSDTRHIDRILIDPNNPDIVYVGAMGHLWGPNKERGVFKTMDGGKTWKKVLYFDELTGIADMAMDPSNSHTIYAAAYYHLRKPYHFTSGGPNSGIYKTTDGGQTWKQLKNGLPEGVNGRCGISICRTRPEVVYALVENKEGGIFRSEDKGRTWKRVGDKKTYDTVNFRPFYYSKITVDPNNPLVVYVYSGRSWVSEDGGKTFTQIGQDLHADHHRIWVDPNNSNHIIDGNDGGIDISWDRGKHWYSVQNRPWAEVYQLTYDMRNPYYVYIGLQDNGQWAGPSNSWQKKGILNAHWTPVGGGDGFYIQVNPKDHNELYRNLQMGNIERFDQRSGQTLPIIPKAPLDGEPYRFNWNSPILLSPHDPGILYFGGNFLFKSTNKGHSWEKISPDLSTNDPEKQKDSGGPITPDNTGAEVHCTIFTLAESPLKPGIIWAGTDDGNLWITQDNGKNWNNVIKNIKGLPPYSWVSRVEASHFGEGTAYVTFDRHRSDDYAPYIHKTANYGKTWVSLRNNLPKTGYLYVIREDPVNRNLLYVGSEFGLFFSFNGGKQWLPFKHKFPTTSVRDLAVHPRENDLIIGTHGRGVYILDHIGPLQQLTPEVTAKDAFLFDLRQATIYYQRKDAEYYAKPVFSAPNPPYGAPITYYLKEKTPKDKPVKFHIYDAEGNKVRTIEHTGNKGLNRVYWPLRGKPVFKKLPAIFKGEMAIWFGIPMGPRVMPGKYKIVLEYKNSKQEKYITLVKAGNFDFPIEDWKDYYNTSNQVNDLLRKGFAMGYGVSFIDGQLKKIGETLKKEKKPAKEVMDKFDALNKKLEPIKKVFLMGDLSSFFRIPIKTAQHGGPIPMQIFMLHVELSNFPAKPTQTNKQRIKEIMQKAFPLFQSAMTILNKDIPELNKLLRKHNFDYIKAPEFPEGL